MILSPPSLSRSVQGQASVTAFIGAPELCHKLCHKLDRRPSIPGGFGHVLARLGRTSTRAR